MQENNPINISFDKKETKTDRPWGSYEILCKGPGYQTKRLIVKPSSRLSLQTHKVQTEKAYVILYYIYYTYTIALSK